MEDKKKSKGGRPTKYTDDLPEKLIEYFNKPLYETYTTETVSAGKVKTITLERPSEFPTVEGFCVDVFRISKDTFYNWVKKHPEFSDAFEAAKKLQKKHLVYHGLNSNYNSAFAKFIAVNCTDLVDKQTIETKEIKVEIDSDDEQL